MWHSRIVTDNLSGAPFRGPDTSSQILIVSPKKFNLNRCRLPSWHPSGSSLILGNSGNEWRSVPPRGRYFSPNRTHPTRHRPISLSLPSISISLSFLVLVFWYFVQNMTNLICYMRKIIAKKIFRDEMRWTTLIGHEWTKSSAISRKFKRSRQKSVRDEEELKEKETQREA